MQRGVVTPYRVPAPTRDAIVRWPAAFGRRFLVFVDVEEEFDWNAPLDPRHRAVTAMRALPAAHARFAERGIGLTCMVDHPVVADAAAVDILRGVIADGRSTIGAQLHSWVTPPFAPPQPGDSFPGNLPPALEEAKLATLTECLTQAFGTRPIAYRAGRYGIGPATAEALVRHGYRLECSMRARYDYSDTDGPDFSAIGNRAFRYQGLIEVPLTTVFTGSLRRGGRWLHPLLGRAPYARGAAARLGLLQRIALTPEDMPIDEALRAVRTAIEIDDERLLSFSFHSPSLVPGHTPYVRDPEGLDRFWTWWERMFALLDALGVAPATPNDVIAAAGGAV